jgi:uncharacterized protein YggU (UPF0235/DUF167 family)
MFDLFNNEIPELLSVRVTANAASNRIKIDYLENGKILIRAYVTAIAENGKANEVLLKMLAKEFNLPIKSLTIIQGLTNRNKIIAIKK